MTNLLKKAIKEVESLPEDEQDAIAASILEDVVSERKWDDILADPRSDAFLKQMGESIRRQRKAGAITSGDKFLQE